MSEWPQRPGFDPASEPTPTEWAPSDPAPAGWAPSDPAPAGWAPSDPAPAGWAPSDPAPAGWAPSDPAPAGWAPVVDYAAPGQSPAVGAAGATRRPGRRTAVGLIGVLALLATGLAVTQLTGADGAGSPEAAVQAFFDAVDDEDALGVLESLSPAERDVLVPSVRRLAEQLDRVELTEGADLEKIGGVDLTVKDLELRTKGLHPDVAAVEVTGGSIAVATKLADLPLGEALSGALGEEGGFDMDEPLDGSAPIELTLVTVKSGDGWHVSLLYSLAEAVRAGTDAPVPDFGNGIPAKGADSPKAAVEAMVAAFNDEDFTRMIELTPPDTMAVLHDYGPGLIDDDAGNDDEHAGDDETRLDDLKLGEPEGSGDTRRVPLDGYRLVQSYDGEESMSYAYDGSCVTVAFPGWAASIDGGPGEPGNIEEDKRCPDDPPSGAVFDYGSFLPPAGPLLMSPGEADIVVVERGGAWYVDPTRTVIETLLGNLDAMSPDQGEKMAERMATLFSSDEDAWYASMGPEMYENCPDVEPPAEDATFEERKEAGKKCNEEEFEGVGAPITDGQAEAEDACYESSDDQAIIDTCLDDVYGTEYEPTPSEDCWASDTNAAIEQCLLGIGDTEGLAELHEMSCRESEDDDAAVERCLQDLVDRGEIDVDSVVEYRCDAFYRDVSDDATDDEWDDAAEAYDQCMADAGLGSWDEFEEDSEEDSGSSSAPASSVPDPAPTTTTPG